MQAGGFFFGAGQGTPRSGSFEKEVGAAAIFLTLGGQGIIFFDDRGLMVTDSDSDPGAKVLGAVRFPCRAVGQ
jgi:hypothetical protein